MLPGITESNVCQAHRWAINTRIAASPSEPDRRPFISNLISNVCHGSRPPVRFDHLKHALAGSTTVVDIYITNCPRLCAVALAHVSEQDPSSRKLELDGVGGKLEGDNERWCGMDGIRRRGLCHPLASQQNTLIRKDISDRVATG